jgi:hypothetical protein
MLSSVEPLAAVGATAIADSPEGADDLYAHVRAVLTNPGQTPALTRHLAVRPVLDTCT